MSAKILRFEHKAAERQHFVLAMSNNGFTLEPIGQVYGLARMVEMVKEHSESCGYQHDEANSPFDVSLIRHYKIRGEEERLTALFTGVGNITYVAMKGKYPYTDDLENVDLNDFIVEG